LPNQHQKIIRLCALVFFEIADGCMFQEEI
jgi:hypothetical protein